MSTAIAASPHNPGTLITKAAEALRHWEQGNEAGYHALFADEATMKIPAYGLDITGFETIWGVRKSMGDTPLAIHAQHTAYVQEGKTVVALSTVYSREDGSPQQHAELKYTFNPDGKIVLYEQDILWKK